MKSIRRSLASLLLLLAVVSPVPGVTPGKKPGAPPARTQAPPVKYGIPRLAPGQLWVSSIPAGLEVRIGENPIAGKVVGRTPVVVDAADAGPFVTVSLLRKEYGADLPHQMDFADFSARTNHSSVRQVDGKEEDYLRALTYEVRLPARQTVIALFQPRSLPLSKVARLYPPGSSFSFSDRVVSKLLAEKGVANESIPEALRFLHRGGKLSLPAGTNWLVAEVTSENVVEVTDLADVLARQRTPIPTPERKP